MLKFTKTFYELVKYKDIPIKIVVGGTRSGKTYGILQYLTIKFLKHRKLTSVVSESMPHMRIGAFRDFKNIVENEIGITLSRENFNKNENIFLGGMEFFGLDNSAKAHGPGRKILFINEIQNIKYDVAFHLSQRTDEEIIYDFNPAGDFWIYEQYIENPKMIEGKDYVLIHSTILDNPFVSDLVKRQVYARAEIDENYRNIYLLGKKGVLEGLIFPNINLVDEMPEDYKFKGYGMDFGFTNDPTTLIDVRIANGELWIDQLIYETDLNNVPTPAGKPNIVDRLNELGDKFDRGIYIIADISEQKSISEIDAYGFNILPIKKQPIVVGIDRIKRYKINITKRSIDVIREFRNYKWKMKDGKATNVPIDAFNHGIDAIRYVLDNRAGEAVIG